MPSRNLPWTAEPLTLDSRHRCIELAGNTIRLPGRAFDLLALLATQPGRIFTTSELMAAVWPDRTVEDNNLRVQVSRLRKHLGQQAIINVPGRGYMLARREAEPAADGAPGVASAAPGVRTASRCSEPRGEDLRVLYRLLGECRDLWADPAAWQAHLLGGVGALVDLPVGLHAQVRQFQPGGTPVVLGAHENGWRDAQHLRAFREGHEGGPAFGYSPLDVVLRRNLLLHADLVHTRAQLLGDREWHASDFYQTVHRPSRMDEMLYSAVRIGRGHRFDLLVFGGDAHQPGARDIRLLQLVHRELVGLLGTHLSCEGDYSMHGLDTEQRRLLQWVALGLSSRSIAERLALRPSQLEPRIGALCAHFGVADRLELMAYLLQRRPKPRVSAGREPR